MSNEKYQKYADVHFTDKKTERFHAVAVQICLVTV